MGAATGAGGTTGAGGGAIGAAATTEVGGVYVGGGDIRIGARVRTGAFSAVTFSPGTHPLSVSQPASSNAAAIKRIGFTRTFGNRIVGDGLDLAFRTARI